MEQEELLMQEISSSTILDEQFFEEQLFFAFFKFKASKLFPQDETIFFFTKSEYIFSFLSYDKKTPKQ